jgi:hypothetical protein
MTKYEIKKNIEYLIKCNIIVEIPELECYGEGETYEEALKELKDEVSDLADDIWDKSEAELGVYPLKWQEYLHEHFERK